MPDNSPSVRRLIYRSYGFEPSNCCTVKNVISVDQITNRKKMLLNSLIKQKIAFLSLLFILLIPGITIKAQATIPDQIIVDGKLKWSDYTGGIDRNSNYWATTHWYVH